MGNLSALGNTVVQTTPVGVIQPFAGINVPAGWLFCDGSAVSRVQYPELFSALSTTYGSGDGSTTFNLPDMRGRVPAGRDNMGGAAANRLTSGNSGITATSLGANGGDERMHQHTHTQNAHSHSVESPAGHSWGANFGGLSGGATFTFSPDGVFAGVYGGQNLTAMGVTATNQNTGSGNSQNVQPTLIVNYIIKAVADLPRAGWTFQQNAPVVTQLPSNPAIGDEVYHLISSNIYHKRWDGTQWQSVANDLIADQVTFDKIATSQTNWAQNTPSAVSVNTTTPTTIATVTFTSRGRGPVLAIGSGDANPGVGGNWHWIALYLDGNQVNPLIINQTAGNSWNNPFAIVRMLGVLSAGSHTIQMRAWQGSGEITYGETGNNQAPSLVVVELI